MAHASFGPIIRETIPAVVATQVGFPARLILGGIRKEMTMNPADGNLGMDRPISRIEVDWDRLATADFCISSE